MQNYFCRLMPLFIPSARTANNMNDRQHNRHVHQHADEGAAHGCPKSRSATQMAALRPNGGMAAAVYSRQMAFAVAIALGQSVAPLITGQRSTTWPLIVGFEIVSATAHSGAVIINRPARVTDQT
jgi:hypothetical protein